jgi:hypothetical protein
MPLARPLLGGLRTALATAFLCMFAGEATANPTGMQVVAGQVSTVTSGNQLLITNSQARFSIGRVSRSCRAS